MRNDFKSLVLIIQYLFTQ